MRTFHIDWPPIPFDPSCPEAINPALDYLSWVAWPQLTLADQDNRDLLVRSFLGGAYKSAVRKRGKIVTAPQMPARFGKVQKKNIRPTIDKAVDRIQERRFPAAMMVLSQWADPVRMHFPRIGLTQDQRKHVSETIARAAAKLRFGDGGGARLRHTHDIGEDVWLESRPALAMTMALLCKCAEFSHSHKTADMRRALASLAYDASWVESAVYGAKALAFCLEQTHKPPALLVPRRSIARTTSRDLIVIPANRLKYFGSFLGVAVAHASENVPAALSPAAVKPK